MLASAGLDLDLEDSSSTVTAGGSGDQRDSTDSASFSIPSLELSDGDGVAVAENSPDVEDGISSSYSALGVEGCPPSAEAPALKDGKMPEAAGEMSPDGFCPFRIQMNLPVTYGCQTVSRSVVSQRASGLTEHVTTR